jgi:hypothetical protein
MPQVQTGSQFTSTIVEQFVQIVNVNIQKCINSNESSQLINVQCDPSPELLLEYQTSNVCTQCQSLYQTDVDKKTNCPSCSPCEINDINQVAMLSYNSGICPLLGGDFLTIQRSIASQVSSQVTNNVQYQSRLKAWWNGSQNQESYLFFLSQINDLIQTTDLSEIMNSMSINQAFTFSGNTGVVHGVTQAVLDNTISNVVSQRLRLIGISDAVSLINNTTTTQSSVNDDNTTTITMIVYIFVGLAFILILLLIMITFMKPNVSRHQKSY